MQEQQQMYGVSERDCVAQPLQQQQQQLEHGNHSSHIKRSCLVIFPIAVLRIVCIRFYCFNFHTCRILKLLSPISSKVHNT